MGGVFVTEQFPGTLTKPQLKSAYEEYIEQKRWDRGNDGYSGTLATCAGLQITDKAFTDHNVAREWLDGQLEKRGAVLAVKVAHTPDVRPVLTYPPGTTAFVGADELVVASYAPGVWDKPTWVTALEVPAAERPALLTAYDRLVARTAHVTKLRRALAKLAESLHDVQVLLPDNWHDSLLQARMEIETAVREQVASKAAYEALAQPLRERLLPVTKGVTEHYWLVGGYAAC